MVLGLFTMGIKEVFTTICKHLYSQKWYTSTFHIMCK